MSTLLLLLLQVLLLPLCSYGFSIEFKGMELKLMLCTLCVDDVFVLFHIFLAWCLQKATEAVEKAKPALESALKSLDSISKQDIAEIRLESCGGL